MEHRSILGRRAATCAALLVGLTGPVGAQDGENAPEPEAAPREVQACLNHPTLRRTRVLSDRYIVFVTRDDTIYVNNLPRECPSLKRGSLVSYPIEQSRLCAGGKFQVLWQTSPNNYLPAFVCTLGYFVPITETELEDLTAATEENRERRPRRRSRREAVTTEQVELPPAKPGPAPAEPTAE